MAAAGSTPCLQGAHFLGNAGLLVILVRGRAKIIVSWRNACENNINSRKLSNTARQSIMCEGQTLWGGREHASVISPHLLEYARIFPLVLGVLM